MSPATDGFSAMMRVLPIYVPALLHRARQTCEENLFCQTQLTSSQSPSRTKFMKPLPRRKMIFTPALTCFLSPPPSPFAPARSRRSTAKTDRRGHCCERFLNIWMLVARTLLTVNWKWDGKRFTFSWGRLEPFGKRRKEFGEAKGRKAERAGTSESTPG